MKILLASSEVHPYSKTGGLADMAGSLAKSLAHSGHRVGLVTPLYAGIPERFPEIKPPNWNLDLPLGPRRVRGAVRELEVSEQFTVYFVDQPAFYQRPAIYHQNGVSYSDNDERFIFFSKAVVNLARYLPWQPELIHLHDWQSGLVPLLIRHQKLAEGWGTAPPTCLTIHNLAYQGVFPAARYQLANLPLNYFNIEGAEFYGQLNCLKAGIIFANALTTVSPRYALEITTPEFGHGLDGLLRRRQSALFGILNGVDYDEWNTLNNPFITQPYSADDFRGKTADKLALQKELGLPTAEDVPIFGSVGRLADQKGVDIMLAALEEMLGADLQFVLLGSGDPAFERAFQNLAQRHPANVAVRIEYDQGLAHRIEAGSDFFLMPSRFEPCGLNQMYSLRYGTVPIVRITGGLDDTVIDITEDAEMANGIKFGEYSSRALVKAIRKGLALYGERELFRKFQINGMKADFSWDRTAWQYEEAYRYAERASGKPAY